MCGPSMASKTNTPNLSISDLADILADLTDVSTPYQLGIQLKINLAELDRIERNHPRDIERQKTEVIKSWLRNSPDASWTTLANAVERMGGHAKLAEMLREQEQSIMGDTTKLHKNESDLADQSPSASHQEGNKQYPQQQNTDLESRVKVLEECHELATRIGMAIGPVRFIMNEHQAASVICKGGEGSISSEVQTSHNESKEPVGTHAESDPTVSTMISPQQKEQLHERQCFESDQMKFKFQKLFTDTKKSLRQEKVPVSELVGHLECLGNIKPTFTDSGLPCLRHQLPGLADAKTVDAVMSVVKDYCSFFNYHMVEHIIDEFGTKQDKENMASYKEEFSKYAECCITQCPSEVGKMSEEGCANLFVTLDDSFDNCAISHLNVFIGNLRKILKIPSTIKLCHIILGSIKLIFQIPLSVQQAIFPLSSEQEAELSSLGVVQLSCGDYQFTLQQTEEVVEEPATDGDYDNTDSGGTIDSKNAYTQEVVCGPSMASKTHTPNLSISDLVDILAALTELTAPYVYQLGIQLKIDSAELDRIEKSHPGDIDRQKRVVITYWLLNSPDASWTTLANAVERMGGHAILAGTLREREQSITGDTTKLHKNEPDLVDQSPSVSHPEGDKQYPQQYNTELEYRVKMLEERHELATRIGKAFGPVRFTMNNFMRYKQTNENWFSLPFYTHPQGYKVCLCVIANGEGPVRGEYTSVLLHLMKGDFDDYLKWPLRVAISVQLFDQEGEGQHHTKTLEFNDRTPSEIANRVTKEERAKFGWGLFQFIQHDQLEPRYLKNNQLCFQIGQFKFK